MDIIKKLSRSIREYKMVSIMTPVCIVFEVIFEILIPFMMAKMIDSGISSGNESALVKYGTLLILCVMAGLVFGILSEVYVPQLGRLCKELRKVCITKFRSIHLQILTSSHHQVL